MQGKLVQCLSDVVYDVVVDLRESSATFGHWQGFELTSENKHALWVPEGLAHGYLVLEKVPHFSTR